MALRVPDLTVHLDEMRNRTAFTDGGVPWLTQVVQQIVDESGLDAQIATNLDADRRRWNLDVAGRGQSMALIDVVNVGPGASVAASLSDLDRVLAKAVRCWQQITRRGAIGQVRPWIGVLAIESGGAGQIDDELNQLVRSRTIDSSVRVTVAQRRAGLDDSLVSLNSFAAGLVARLAYVKEALPVA